MIGELNHSLQSTVCSMNTPLTWQARLRSLTSYASEVSTCPSRAKSSTVIDLSSRRLAGWPIAEHMRADLVTDALAAAIHTCGNLVGSIMHNDH
ncbi:hypothetical protein [Streptomyces drozdowiczii]|uniref:hypothetical protein n=1 Tax=Streptomyces drozdowiczii TaxID=202862 RepID=UPI003D2F2683